MDPAPMCILLLVAGALSLEPEPQVQPAFLEVAAEVGLDFVHFNGMSGKLYTPEVLGAGVALLDYDNDGDLDVYLGQGGRLDDGPVETLAFPPAYPAPLTDRLYRNDLGAGEDGEGRLRFTDVTEQSGLTATGYAMGVATGDYDNDGWVDLYVTNLGPNHLFRNRGDGTFVEVTREAGADDRRWSVPALFFDYDNDGWLDLFVGNYHHFRVGSQKRCYLRSGVRDYCGPLAEPAEADRLLHNRGDGTFADVTIAAGLDAPPATALGAVVADFDADGRQDLFVANDGMANHLWLNRGDGTFFEDALLRGVAFDGDGKAQASMGVVAGDLDGNGAVDLFLSHLVREYSTLYLNDGTGLFADRSRQSGLIEVSWQMTGFGTAILDYDGDGVPDLFVVNGAVHLVEEQLRRRDPHPLRMENHLYRGLGGGRFEEVPGPARERPVHVEVSRGLAVGDVDNDGDPDLVLSNNAGPVRLLRNRRRPGERWLGVRLADPEGRRPLYGAQAAWVTGRGEQPLRWQRVHTDGSYAAASDPRLILPLEPTDAATVRVRWPDGAVEDFAGLGLGRYVTLQRGAGRPPP